VPRTFLAPPADVAADRPTTVASSRLSLSSAPGAAERCASPFHGMFTTCPCTPTDGAPRVASSQLSLYDEDAIIVTSPRGPRSLPALLHRN
jgi:hypothetical protein